MKSKTFLLTAFLMVSCDDLFDFSPPTIKVLEPAENANVKDSLDIKAIVEDNVGVEHVEFFFLDGNEKLAKTIIKEEPYERKLKTMSGILGVKAFDEAGNHSTKKVPLHFAYYNLTAPNGGENWHEQTTQKIKWNSGGELSDNVKLYYSLNGEGAWTLIGKDIPDSGTYSWLVPNISSQSDSCVIKIMNNIDGTIYDYSDSFFTLTADSNYIQLATPNGGESWNEQTEELITWSSSGNVTALNLLYSLNGGVNWFSIAAGEENDGSYSWDIPNLSSSSDSSLVKVEDTVDGSIADISENYFSLIADSTYLQITHPYDGDIFNEQTSITINWHTSGDISNYVNLDYSTDGGNSWNAIASNTVNLGMCSWTIPDLTTSSDSCLVKIEDKNDTAYFDISDGFFTLLADSTYIEVTNPNGGESWHENTVQSIEWSTSGDVSVTLDLYYSTDGGSNWNEIASNIANLGVYSWTIPDLTSLSNSCLVKVQDSANSDLYDVSDSHFTITVDGYQLTSPNGGESFHEQTTQTITWSSSGSSVSYDVKLYYSTDSGSSWNVITELESNDGDYPWTIPDLTTSSDACLVKVEDSSSSDLYDISDAPFTITADSYQLTSPNGGEIWNEKTTQTITWSSSGSNVSGVVSLSYSTDNGSNWSSIEGWTSNDGEESWSIPDFNLVHPASFDSCLVKVEDYNHSGLYDISDSWFTIKPDSTYIQVISPNGGENWTSGTTQKVKWVKKGEVGSHLTLEYSIDSGTNWMTSETIYYANQNDSTDWTVPEVWLTSATSRIRLTDRDNTDIYDISDGDFTITAGGGDIISVTSPNGGENWQEQTLHDITWTVSGDIESDDVDIYYSKDGGSNWSGIDYQTSNDGTHGWELPDLSATTDKGLVRVRSKGNGNIFDVSDSYFTMKADSNYYQVLTPNGGETLTMGTSYDITWKSGGDASSVVKLYYSTDGGSGWYTIDTYESNDGSYSWTVPTLSEASSQCLIRIVDYSEDIQDQSDAVFTIE